MLKFIPSLAVGRQGLASGGTFYRSLTIDHTQVLSTQANFPVLVSFTDTTFKTTANDGHVAATNAFTFSTDSAGTSLLSWEVERYDATTGEIVAWVKIASVSSVSDTVFYLRYGSTILTDQSDPTNVWTNSYLGVYHLKDGTTLSVLDSLNSNNGTNHSATATTGQIDGGGGFASASSQYIDFGTGINPAAITLSIWAKATTLSTAYSLPIGRVGGSQNYTNILVKSTGKLCMSVGRGPGNTNGYDGSGSTTLSTGTWYRLTLTCSSAGGLKGYVNDSLDGSSTGLDSNVAGATAQIGGTGGYDAAGNFNTGYWNGALDEGSFSSVIRSADWIALEYANQKTSSTLVALGSET